MRTITFLAISLLLSACGGDSGGGGAAGTYVIDGDAMMPEIEKFVESMIAPQLEAMKGMLDMLPEDQRAAKEKEVADSIKSKMAEKKEEMKREFTLEVKLNGDGSFTALDEGKTKAKGTWKLDGSTLTFVATEEDGKKKDPPETITGTYKDGTIRFRPEKEMPFDIIMRKK